MRAAALHGGCPLQACLVHLCGGRAGTGLRADFRLHVQSSLAFANNNTHHPRVLRLANSKESRTPLEMASVLVRENPLCRALQLVWATCALSWDLEGGSFGGPRSREAEPGEKRGDKSCGGVGANEVRFVDGRLTGVPLGTSCQMCRASGRSTECTPAQDGCVSYLFRRKASAPQSFCTLCVGAASNHSRA